MSINLLGWSSIALLNLMQEVQTSFDDLGKLMLGGISAAILVAVAFTLVRLRLRDKSPTTSNFISISATEKKEEKVSGS
jgi:hypothetical protein